MKNNLMESIEDFKRLTGIIKKEVLIQDIEFASSINALDNNSSVIRFYLDTMNETLSNEHKNLRLYGLLQVLFVSIDALYSLCFSVTNTKNFITLNDNKSLRELKYIRNDVVGHPTNRKVKNKTVYCILDPNNIEQDKFSYTIFFDSLERKRTVDIVKIISSYYKESIHIFKSILKYNRVHQTVELKDDVYRIILEYKSQKDISGYIICLEKDLNQRNLSSRTKRKICLIKKLLTLKTSPLNRFVTEYQIIKLYDLVCSLEKQKSSPIKMLDKPLEIKEAFQLFDLNKQDESLKDALLDTNHPLFFLTLNKMIEGCKQYNLRYGLDYFNKILECYENKEKDLVYAYSSILKLYKVNYEI